MLYSREEKAKCEEILKVFGAYIRESTCFDILHSDKCGYMKVIFYCGMQDDHWYATRYRDSVGLLNGILDEIANDVRELQLTGQHMTSDLSYDEALEVCKRVDQIIKKSGTKNADDYMKSLESFLEGYQHYEE